MDENLDRVTFERYHGDFYNEVSFSTSILDIYTMTKSFKAFLLAIGFDIEEISRIQIKERGE